MSVSYGSDGRISAVYGYDGSCINRGSRVELHPGTDLWMRGVRYGTVVGFVDTVDDMVRVELDKMPGRRFSGHRETFDCLFTIHKGE